MLLAVLAVGEVWWWALLPWMWCGVGCVCHWHEWEVLVGCCCHGWKVVGGGEVPSDPRAHRHRMMMW